MNNNVQMLRMCDACGKRAATRKDAMGNHLCNKCPGRTKQLTKAAHLGRNSKCFCGSSKKYKHCCMRKVQGTDV